MTGFKISFDIGVECERVAAAFREYGERALPRATQFAANGVAIGAVTRLRKRIPQVLDHPVDKTVDAPSYLLDRKALAQITSIGEVRTTVYINPVASIWTKYLFNEDGSENRREPGDVGLAERKILIPFWENIRIVTGVGPDRAGNVPKGLYPRVRGMLQPGQKPGAWQGQIKVKGRMVTALIARPVRGKGRDGGTTEFTDSRGRRRVVPKVVGKGNQNVPRILFLEVDHADYDPLLQKPWDESLAEAADTFGDRLDAELEEKRAFRARRG